MNAQKSTAEGLPLLADGYSWEVSTYPRLDAIDHRPEVRVTLRRSSRLSPRLGRILAEAWFLPESHRVPETTSTEDIARQLAENLLRTESNASKNRDDR